MSYERVEIGNAVLYRGDCREVLPLLEAGGAIVTDPPYGIGASGGTGKYGRMKWQESDSRWDESTPDDDLFAALLAAAPAHVIWGMNYFRLPPCNSFLVWDKGAGFKGRSFSECELAWCSVGVSARILTRDPLAMGDYKGKQHPTQKPVAVMEWSILQLGERGRTEIRDPFMGAGTTGVACARLNLPFIGIELNPRYFDIACKRIEAAQAQQDLFAPTPAGKATQEALFGEETA